MTKNYYRSEYSDRQWKALIDKAEEYRCEVTYSKYGNIAMIDSTPWEDIMLETLGGWDRQYFAENVHKKIQAATDFRKWKVQPERYHRGYCPTVCSSRTDAEIQQDYLTGKTGFKWIIKEIEE